MAHVALSDAISVSGKNVSIRQKRLELEKEVAQLQKVLSDEERVHEVLQRALLPQNSRLSFHIPNFLPKRTKELLAELVMVEEEIARLEREISKVQQGLSKAQESRDKETAEVSGYKHAHTTRTESPKSLFASPTQDPQRKVLHDKVVLETKPMFFINQAMKGDYMVNAFNKKASAGSMRKANFTTENQKTLDIKARVSRTQGIAEAVPTHMPPPKHQNSISSENAEENLLEFLKEPASVAISSDKQSGKFQPSKLAEKIMRCLLCIFSRLMRTSRALHLEKLSNKARSDNSLLRSGSFRLDGTINLKGSGHIQRETGQQDPYGIFEIEVSIIRDIGPYKNLVKFTSSSFDPKAISSSIPLLEKLRMLISTLREVNLQFLSHQEKLAFWINIYNSCIMHGFLELGMPMDPEKVQGLRNMAMINVGGNKLNGTTIEQIILRHLPKLSEDDMDGKQVRKSYGLDRPEANISFALCSGCKSSPAVKIYTGDGILNELERSKLEYLQASIVVTATKRIMIPSLLISNMLDFATDLNSLVDWIINQLPTSWPLRKSMVECLKGQNSRKLSDIVEIIPEDFEFQYLLPA